MKFIVTKELGRLARWLRILGYDTIYYTNHNIASMIILALREKRIILTRRKKIKTSIAPKIIQIKSEEVKSQIGELIKKLSIKVDESKMFTRCIICNKLLKDIAKQKIKQKVPEYVYKTHRQFCICNLCQRIYWQGTHWGNVSKILREITEKKPETSCQ